MTVIYKNKVLGDGACAEEFRPMNMLIIFGSSAPAELKDFCYLVDVNPIEGTIEAGDTLRIDEKDYRITSVGDEAPVTLAGLGHCTINFSGLTEPEMAGTIYVEKVPMPQIQTGTTIQIIKA